MSAEDTDNEAGERAAGAAVAEEPDKRPEAIAGMFDAIAGRYDLLNHLLSGGMDLYWRARAVRSLGFTGREVVLDLCTGTCDLAIAALRAKPSRAARVIGIDFSAEMLRIGQRKLGDSGLGAAASLVRGDVMALPVASSSVDAVTIAFGIRNVVAPEVACAEVGRVLRPGGRLAVLEFSFPKSPTIRAVYTWYFRNVLPAIGRAISRHDHAYTYLPQSVGTFFPPDRFSALVRRAGLSEVRSVPLTFGIVYLYTAVKPGAVSPG